MTHPENKNVKITLSKSEVDYSSYTFKQILDSKLNGQKTRANSVLGLEFIFAFTPGCVETENIKNWGEASMRWLSEKFGSDNINSLVLSHDKLSVIRQYMNKLISFPLKTIIVVAKNEVMKIIYEVPEA